MNKVYFNEKTKKPIKMWLNNIDEKTLKQATNLANLPFLFKHVAIMADAHQGYGMPIGGVIACKDVVVPNAVGVDIGCGMTAIKTNFKNINEKNLKQIVNEIKNEIPVGFNHNKVKQYSWLDDSELRFLKNWNLQSIVLHEYQNSLYQLGTLGGGNHFIEIQKDKNELIWIMIHTGSRNMGLKVAQHYNKIAKDLNQKWYSKVSSKVDLAFLPLENKYAINYLHEMELCKKFAMENRNLIANKIKSIFRKYLMKIDFEHEINISHNYATIENHFGKKVVVHRKGATSAKKGEMGIIPGSQGTKSYIVKGLGNKESFMSCSHGAGRKMSRKAACRNLNFNEQKEILDAQNIIHDLKKIKDLDEAPGAYKSIKEVMKNQLDLIDVVEELSPIAVIKG